MSEPRDSVAGGSPPLFVGPRPEDWGPFQVTNFRLFTQEELRHVYGLDIEHPNTPFDLDAPAEAQP